MATIDQSTEQAGGGVPDKLAQRPKKQAVGPLFREKFKAICADEGSKYNLKTAGGLDDFLVQVQGAKSSIQDESARAMTADATSTLEDILTGPEGDILQPIAVEDDMSMPLSSYFISSSHNTYLTGNQLYSDSSTDGYKNVLLRGCRCVEIDVWDGHPPSDSSSDEAPSKDKDGNASEKADKSGMRSRLMGKIKRTASRRGRVGSSSNKSPTKTSPTTLSPAQSPTKESEQSPERIAPWRSDSSRVEPRVLHGYTATKEIPFRDVCEAIRDNAFTVSDLPVIVSLEVHTSLEQQEVMVDIMKTTWKKYLVEHDDPHKQDLELPLPKDLKNKILIKVKYSPPKKEAPPSPALKKKVAKDTSSDSSASGDEPSNNPEKPKPSKIIEGLSRLGIYTRSYHFSNFDAPEATVPTHVFSLSEKGLMEAHQQFPAKLFKHNRKFMMRAYPKGLRISSSNLEPSVFWRKGVQIVALNWQKWDAGMMLNEAMFAGSKGYILKPKGYHPGDAGEDQSTTPGRGTLSLAIKFIAGQSIPLPKGDENPKGFKPYVKCILHVEKPEERKGEPIPGGGKVQEGKDQAEYKQYTKSSQTPEPDFGGQTIKFDGISNIVPELSFVRFKVMDDELGKDDCAAWACIRLDRVRTGYRLIHLFDTDGVRSEGRLLVHISKKFVSKEVMA